jgi:hypothetical protein
MPTGLRFAGFSVVIYPADHIPAHVHVFGGGNSGLQNPIIVPLTGSAPENRRIHGQADEFAAATRRANERRATSRARRRHYDKRRGRIVVSLSNGLTFPPAIQRALRKPKRTTSRHRDQSSDSAFIFRSLTRTLPARPVRKYWLEVLMASQLGASGGSTRSVAKAAAARQWRAGWLAAQGCSQREACIQLYSRLCESSVRATSGTHHRVARFPGSP